MSTINENSTVKVHYTGKLLNNVVFDSSVEREPLEITLGKGLLIPGFEKALHGLAKGETKTITIPAEEAYGPVITERIQEIERQYVPENVELGQQLSAETEQGTINVVVVDIKENTVVLDGNHPLAGQDLVFELEVIEILNSEEGTNFFKQQ